MMVNILTKLRIDEVSSVDRGAGEGVKIVLMKRDDDDFDEMVKHNSARGWHRQRLQQIFAKLADEPRDDDDEARTSTIEDDDKVSGRLKDLAAAMIVAEPTLTEETAMFYLLHHPHGRALAREHLKSSTAKTEKEPPPMNRSDELQSIAKAGSWSTVCKHIIARGETSITQQEFEDGTNEYVKLKQRDGETFAKAYSRIYENDVELRKALAIIKDHEFARSLVKSYARMKPTSTEVGNTNVTDDSAEAVRLLSEMAEKQRRTFEQVFQDPDNKALAARTYTAAHRPTASSTSGDELQRR